MEYTYNLSGALVEEKYPSGRVVRNVLDNDGDLSMVQSKRNANYGYWNYAHRFTYTAAGAVSSMQLGNGTWEKTAFNSRLQPTQIALGRVPNATDLLKLDYTYGVIENNQLNTAKNNGNVQSQTITVPNVTGSDGFTAVQTYSYDSLNRIDDATEKIGSTEIWKQDYAFDRYGNRNFDEANTTTIPKNCGTPPNLTVCPADRKVFNPNVNASNNRLGSSDGYQFDAAGNTIRDPQNRKFTYDAENKQTKVETVDANGNVTGTIGQYSYDGDGRRVKKHVPSTGETTVFVYDASSRLVAEFSTIQNPTPQVAYLTTDHLGSPRINTNETGAVISRHDYRAYGEEIIERTHSQYAADTIRKQFTGYERDDETSLDCAKARTFASSLGRFTSPDPLLFSAKVEDAQTWNRFVYSLNNPLRFTDPSGMFIWSNDLGGDRNDGDLEAYYTGEANKIKDKKKREKALRNVSDKVQKIINKRKELRAAIDRAKESLSNLSGSQKEAVERAINSYGEEGKTNKNVVLGQWAGGGTTGTALFGENGIIFVMLGNVSGDGLANQFAHEGSHVADIQDFNAGVAGSDLTNTETERKAWSVSAFVAKGLGNETYPESLPRNLRVWNRGWTESQIATAVSNRIAGPGYENSRTLLSEEKPKNIRTIRSRIDSGAWSNWY